MWSLLEGEVNSGSNKIYKKQIQLQSNSDLMVFFSFLTIINHKKKGKGNNVVFVFIQKKCVTSSILCLENTDV